MRWSGFIAAILLVAGLAAPAVAMESSSPDASPDASPDVVADMAGGTGGVLARVRHAGVLRCGVTASGAGLSTVDARGQWSGFFADMCRTVAAAVLGSATAVDFVEVSTHNRFSALREDAVDVVMDGATWTLQRDATFGIDFPAVYLFDGQGFMVNRSMGVRRLADLRGGTVCVIGGTTTERNLTNWIAASGRALAIKVVQSTEGALTTFFNHHCDVLTNDRISLHAQRQLNAPNRDDYLILPEVISKEPLSPMIKAGDASWYRVVRWSILATILAEEKGVTARIAATLKDSPDAEVRKLLALAPGLGEGLGLDDPWGRRVITQLGNYGEIFDRNLGPDTVLGIERGPNAQWNQGGLMFAPPLGG